MKILMIFLQIILVSIPLAYITGASSLKRYIWTHGTSQVYNHNMAVKTRASRRSQRTRIINRKVSILRKYGGEKNVFAWSRGNTGRFAKGKIHCSCWMCRDKSYDDLSYADKKRLLAARQQLNEEV